MLIKYNVPFKRVGAFFIAISNHMNNQAFHIGDVVTQRKVNDDQAYSYPDMRVVEKIPPNYLLCEWYNKNWAKWERTPFNSSELVKI